MNPGSLTPPQRIAVLAAIDPQSVAAGASVASPWVSMAGPNRLLATLMLGAITAGGTIDAKLQQATKSDGTGTKDAGRAVTQIPAASGSNKQAYLHIEDEDLDTSNGYQFLRLIVTAGGQAAQVAALLQGLDFREMPASDNQAATVIQNVG